MEREVATRKHRIDPKLAAAGWTVAPYQPPTCNALGIELAEGSLGGGWSAQLNQAELEFGSVGSVDGLLPSRQPRAVPVALERGAYRAARALVALVGEGHDPVGGQGIDQAHNAGRGQVVHGPGQSRTGPDQAAVRIGEDLEFTPWCLCLPE